MKAVYKKTPKITFKKICWFLAIIIGYYAAVFLYGTLCLLFEKHHFNFKLIETNYIMIYLFLVAPIFNGITHITYSELGLINYKFFVWINSLVITFAIPINIFFN